MACVYALRSAHLFKQTMKRAAQIPLQACVCDLRYKQRAVWREAAGMSPCEVNKQVVTYESWCGCALLASGRAPFKTPLYLSKKLDGRVVR